MNIQFGKISVLIAFTSVSLLAAGSAWAHPRLQKSEPAQGSVTEVAPKNVVLRFSEDLVPNFSKIEVKQLGTGKTVSEGKAQAVKGEKNALEVPLKQPLVKGKYQVIWRATSVDTHHVQGKFDFTYGTK